MIDMHAELEAAERAYAADWANTLPAAAQQKQPTPTKPAHPNLQAPDPQAPSQPPPSEQQQQRSRPVRATRPPRAPDVAAVNPGQLAAAQRPPGSAAAAADAACPDGRARRAVANRQSAARSKERRRLYVEGLEHSVKTLSAQVQEQEEHMQTLTANTEQLGATNRRLSTTTQDLDSRVQSRAAEVAALQQQCAQLRAAAAEPANAAPGGVDDPAPNSPAHCPQSSGGAGQDHGEASEDGVDATNPTEDDMVEAPNADAQLHDTMNFAELRTTSVGGDSGGGGGGNGVCPRSGPNKTGTDADGSGVVRASADSRNGCGSSAASYQRIAAIPGSAGTEGPAGPPMTAAAAPPQLGSGGPDPYPTPVQPEPLPNLPAGGAAGSSSPVVDVMGALAADSDLNGMLSVLASDPVDMLFDKDPLGASGDA